MEKINQLFAAGMKKAAVPAAFAVSMVASPVFAADEGAAVKAAIAKAIAAGQENYGAVTVGVITVAALGFCVGMMVGWLKK